MSVSITAVTSTLQLIRPAGSYLLLSTGNYLFTGNVALTLPITANAGDIFVINAGPSAWSIGQHAGQQINFGGTAHTTNGTSGSVSSNSGFDYICCSFICIVDNLTWAAQFFDVNHITWV